MSALIILLLLWILVITNLQVSLVKLKILCILVDRLDLFWLGFKHRFYFICFVLRVQTLLIIDNNIFMSMWIIFLFGLAIFIWCLLITYVKLHLHHFLYVTWKWDLINKILKNKWIIIIINKIKKCNLSNVIQI